MRSNITWGIASLVCGTAIVVAGATTIRASMMTDTYVLMADDETEEGAVHRCVAQCDGVWVDTGRTCPQRTRCCGWFHCPSGAAQHTCCYSDQQCHVPVNNGITGILACEVIP